MQDAFLIQGGKALSGTITATASKNATLPIMAAALLADSPVTLTNVPAIADVRSLAEILRQLNVSVELNERTHYMRIDASGLKNCPADSVEVQALRASYYLLGAMLGRFGEAQVAYPGGCNFDSRPIDQHMKAFKGLGATEIPGELISLKAEKLCGAEIYFDMESVGATINAMLAAVKAEGVTTLINVAKEPHIVDVANFLNAMGARVRGAGSDTIRIQGVTELHGVEYTIIPDQIEIGTYMLAAAVTGGCVRVENVIPQHMDCLSAKLLEMGIKVEEYENAICVDARGSHPTGAVIKTAPYPGFPTDLQSQLAVLMVIADGESRIIEGIYAHRFGYLGELTRMGAGAFSEGNEVKFYGNSQLKGNVVTASDLRAGAALILAGLVAEGETKVQNVALVDRGYEHLERKLRMLGADIERVSE